MAVTACNLICDVVGIQEFIRLVKAADLNPIWLCQEIKLCPIDDCTASECATFIDNQIYPTSGNKGTTFTVQQVFQVLQKCGTGSIVFEVVPPKGQALGDEQLVADGFAPGNYELRYGITLKDDPEKQVYFEPGLYNTHTFVCEGLCGSHHAHTRVLAVANGNFTLTN